MEGRLSSAQGRQLCALVLTALRTAPSQKENVGGSVEKRLLEALERKAVAQLRTGTRGKLLVENAGFAASTPSVVRFPVLRLTASPARTGTRTHENTHNSDENTHNSDISLAHS